MIFYDNLQTGPFFSETKYVVKSLLTFFVRGAIEKKNGLENLFLAFCLNFSNCYQDF